VWNGHVESAKLPAPQRIDPLPQLCRARLDLLVGVRHPQRGISRRVHGWTLRLGDRRTDHGKPHCFFLTGSTPVTSASNAPAPTRTWTLSPTATSSASRTARPSFARVAIA